MQLRKGDKWASIEVLDFSHQSVSKKSRGITETVRTPFALLKCNCGEVWQQNMYEFPGRRKLRNCGNCSVKVETTKVVSAHFDMQTYEYVVHRAKCADVTVSRMVRLLCKEAMVLGG